MDEIKKNDELNDEFGGDVDAEAVKLDFINFINKLNPYDYLLLISLFILLCVMIWHTNEITACNNYYQGIIQNLTFGERFI